MTALESFLKRDDLGSLIALRNEVVMVTGLTLAPWMCIPFFSVPELPHFSESSDFYGLLRIPRNTSWS
jgi:hypothetical protein